MKKQINSPILILNLTNAILPINWPKEIPLEIPIVEGKYEKDYDIVKNESWTENPSVRNYVGSNDRQSNINELNKLPIGINTYRLPAGSFISDENGNIIYEAKKKDLYLKDQKTEENKKTLTISQLKEKYPLVKNDFIIDFDDTITLLLNNKAKRPILDPNVLYNTFSDILISGGGSLYPKGDIASLGAYSSVIDFPTLDTTLSLFRNEELFILHNALSNISGHSPLHSVMAGRLETLLSKTEQSINKIKP